MSANLEDRKLQYVENVLKKMTPAYFQTDILALQSFTQEEPQFGVI